ncbi:DUF305 domain-containing protein [Glycomyces sp. TRM65418]|uniref:DUF305 domain-containing protein n=1 Tax=Glycomyces sp. TRM65418 TaxID=2867006 RepID=UPI001CE6E808|nr:DUF305 domain-containing protein [Glycomyces sp. TRM65418]MCC3764995.1 DUF305 domain-containing protein [Glycomyces sp. TRM65418]QZD54627.1 DUF305 domain-containing protein [Glycomyces sp. TRM65418]
MSRLWRRPAVLIAITAVLMLGAGFAVGWVAGTAAPGDDSAEAGFARDMQTHHQQAVEMAMYEWRNGGDETLRTVAYDIATAQSAEIGMFRSWLREWGVQLSTGEPMAWAGEEHQHDTEAAGGLMPGMATDEEMATFKTLTGADADIMFIEMMIEHHIGGVDMAKVVLDLSENERVVDAAERTITVQQAEIESLENHLERIRSSVEG